MASDQGSGGDMLFSGTGRTLRAMMTLALMSVVGLLVMVALLSALVKDHSEPMGTVASWEWDRGYEILNRLGASVIDGVWAMLALFATLLVAVALAGRESFTRASEREDASTTMSGLLRGAYDHRLSIRTVGQIGFYCGTYLSIAVLLILVHVAGDLIEGTGSGRWETAVIVLPLMIGGILLAARLGPFISGVEVTLRELRSSQEKLERRCAELHARVAPDGGLSAAGSAGQIIWSTCVLAMPPMVILGVFALSVQPSKEVLILWTGLWTTTVLLAALAVLTPWMTDALNGWTEMVFKIWWLGVVWTIHILWAMWALFVLPAADEGGAAAPFIAVLAYLIPLFIFGGHHRTRRKQDRGARKLWRRTSPFIAADRVTLGDRSRQLRGVKEQIRDLQKVTPRRVVVPQRSPLTSRPRHRPSRARAMRQD